MINHVVEFCSLLFQTFTYLQFAVMSYYVMLCLFCVCVFCCCAVEWENDYPLFEWPPCRFWTWWLGRLWTVLEKHFRIVCSAAVFLVTNSWASQFCCCVVDWSLCSWSNSSLLIASETLSVVSKKIKRLSAGRFSRRCDTWTQCVHEVVINYNNIIYYNNNCNKIVLSLFQYEPVFAETFFIC